MKPSFLPAARLSLPLATALAALLAAQAASATNYYWDTDGVTAGSGGATPNGTWAASGSTWSTSSTGALATSAYTTLSTDDLFFSAGTDATGAYAITLTSSQNAQSLTFEDGSATISGTGGIINLGGSGTIAVSAGLSATIGNNTTTKIAGSAGLRKIANGTLTLNGSAVNTFTGGVTVNGGTLVLDYTNLATPTNLVDSANALQINNAALTITGKNVAAATTAQTFAGTSLGAGINTVNIAKGALATSATLNLGALTANSGSLTTFSPTTAWTATASTTEKVFITAGGSVPSLPGAGTTAFVNAGLFHRVAGGAVGTLRLAAVDSNGQLLLKANAGNLAVGTGVDPAGSYQLNAGSIALTNTGASVYGLLLNATGAGTNITLANGGTLTLNSVIQIKATESVNIVAGTGTSNVVIGSEKNLVLAMDNAAGLAINAPIANNGSTGGTGGTASALTIVGSAPTGTPGTVTLGGANTYSGATTITKGTLALGNANALQNTSGLTLGGASAATLTNSGDVTGISINGAITAANSGVTSTISFSRNTANAGTLTLSGGITGGGGNVTFTTPNVNSGGNVQTITLGGGVGSAGGYGGSTTLGVGNTNNAITLRSGIDNALPTTTVLTFAQNNGVGSGRATTFDLNGFNQTLAGLSNTGVVPENRNMTVTSATAATLTINSTASQTFGGRTISTTVSTIGTNTRAAITGAISLVKNGTGTFTLGGTLSGGAVAAGNTFTGDTKITAGILVLGESLSIQNSAFDTGSSITGDTTNGLRAGIGGTGVTTLTLGGLTGGNNFSTRFTTTTGGYTGLTGLTLNPGTGVTNSYSADIGNGNGSMTLTKTGAGTQTLSAANSYTGATNVNAGKLTLASTGTINSTSGVSIGAGEFNYNSATALSQGVSFSGTGGKLSGSGTITPAVTVTAGNTLAPGNSIGTLSFGSGLTLAGTYSVELGTVNADPALSLSDRSAVTGDLTVGGNLTLVDNANANSQGSAAAGAYRIATYTGNLSGTFATVTNPLSSTLHEKVVYGPASGGGNVDLNLYRLATGSTGAVALGKARVGDTLTGNLTTTNSSTADGFSENLNASVGSNAGDVNASSGTVSGVIAGANASTISVGLDTNSSGAKSGSVLVSYTSDGTGTSGYGTTANGSQTVTVTGDVYELASATLGGADVGSLVGSNPTYTLDFGSGLALNTLYTMSFSIQNGAVANAFKDSLTGDYSLAGAGFGTDAIDFSGLAAGSAANLFNITFMTNSEGSYSGTFTFDGTSVQSGLSDVSVGDFTIALTATAVPEPRAALLGGLGLLALLRRRRVA